MTVLRPKRGALIMSIPLFIRVQPLARPRASRAGSFTTIYQPKGNQKELLHALDGFFKLNIIRPVIIDTFVNLKPAPSTELEHPTGKNHGDEDNLRKAICDALVSRHIIADDSLILGGSNFKVYGPENAAIIDIYEVNPDLVAVADDTTLV